MFYLVGLGLYDAKDVTVRGLEVIRKAKRVYLEAYTAILMVNKEALEEYYEREVILADRELVEQNADEFLEPARNEDIVLLVVGDPFAATTHTDLVTRCKEKKVKVEAIHNASIINAVGCCGLQLYNFGRAVSICFFTENWRPDSFYPKIVDNSKLGLHTLCLLDIKVKEQSIENLMKGNKIFEPPRYMSINKCIEQFFEVEEKHKGGICARTARAVGVARVGSPDQTIVSGTLEELSTVDFGAPLHSLVLVGEVDEIEKEMLDMYAVSESTPRLKKSAEGEKDEEDEKDLT
eukprot:m.40517 g.40517  ORF g.40517 m.40517 type:complete len:292 (-) comp16755_c0_seq2:19-894(-)